MESRAKRCLEWVMPILIILSAILFHFSGNAFGELFELSGRAEVFNFVAGVMAAFAVVALWGPKTLTRGTRSR